MKIQTFFMVILSAFMLVACGGGGGGSTTSASSGSSSTPPVRTRTIEVSQSSVAFEAEQYGNPPASQTLNLTFDAPLLTLGFPPGVTPPDWLGTSVNQTSETRGSLTLSITDTNLDPGTYETTVRAISSDESGNTVFDTVDIPISYTVTPITPITINVDEITVTVAPIQDPVTTSIILTGEGVTWEVNSFNAGVTLSPSSGTIPTDGQMVDIIFDPTAIDPAVDTVQNITFRNANAPLSDTTLRLNIVFVDGIFTDPDELTFQTVAGDTITQSETINIDNFDITEAAQINWAANSDRTWLTVTPISGIVETSAASTDPSEAVITVDPTGLEIGFYEGTVSFTNDISDQVFNVPVSFVIAERKIVTGQVGVGFSSQSDLTTSISVLDGFGTPIEWMASTDASWLTVTPSGTAGDDITITANPAGLANNTLSEAIVTVTSPLADISNIVEISVGLWNSDEATDEHVIAIETNSVGPSVFIETDPIRPYVYTIISEVSDGTSPPRTTLHVHHAYTGEEIVAPISSDVFVSPVAIASDDGRYLYIFPGSSDGSDGQFERYDLPALGTPTRFDLPAGSIGGHVDFTRVNGVAYLLTGVGGVIDAESGTVLSSLRSLDGGAISASQNGSVCLRNGEGNNQAVLDCFNLFGTGLSQTDIAARSSNRNANILDPANFAISADGSAVYTVLNGGLSALATNDSATELFTIDAEDVSLIDVSANGNIFVDGFSDDFTTSVIQAFNPDGSPIGSAPAGLDFPLDFSVTSDGKRIALLETDFTTGEDIILRLSDAP